MKYVVLIACSFLLSISSFAQHPDEAIQKVKEGVSLHDKGLFDQAIAKYKEALELDKDNINALCEIAYSYRALKKYNESNSYAKRAIETHLDNEFISHAFTTLGSNYDDVKDTTNALKAFRQGLHYFPDNSELNFNFGITLTGMDPHYWPEAEQAFIKCTQVNPNYPSPYNALGRLQFMQEKRITGILVLGRFMILEDPGARRDKAYDILFKAFTYGYEKTGKKTELVINLNLPDTTEEAKNRPNNFDQVEMILTIGSAIASSNKKSDLETLKTSILNLCNALEEGKATGTGYYWEKYAPFYIELKNKNFVDTYAELVYISANDKKSKKWFKKNESKVREFYNWYFSYGWE